MSQHVIAPSKARRIWQVKVLAGKALGRCPGTAKEFVEMVMVGWWWQELQAEARYRAQVSTAGRAKVEAIKRVAWAIQYDSLLENSWELKPVFWRGTSCESEWAEQAGEPTPANVAPFHTAAAARVGQTLDFL